MLEKIEQAIAGVHEKVARSVVGVGSAWGAGSGVVLDKGLVLTNAHNLRGDKVKVFTPGGGELVAKVAGADTDRDLAVLTVDDTSIPALQMGSTSPYLGKAVFAVSNPGGRGTRVSLGFVSGLERSFRGPRGRKISGAIEHTAPLLPGSSGGPLVDEHGDLLGINTNRLGEGYYLAIAADSDLTGRLDSLRRGEVKRPRRLGVAIAPSEVARRLRKAVGLDEAEGLLVRGVEEGSPASAAGIREGDLIVEVAGRSVATLDDLYVALDEVAGEVSMALLRGNDRLERSVRFEGSDA